MNTYFKTLKVDADAYYDALRKERYDLSNAGVELVYGIRVPAFYLAKARIKEVYAHKFRYILENAPADRISEKTRSRLNSLVEGFAENSKSHYESYERRKDMGDWLDSYCETESWRYGYLDGLASAMGDVAGYVSFLISNLENDADIERRREIGRWQQVTEIPVNTVASSVHVTP